MEFSKFMMEALGRPEQEMEGRSRGVGVGRETRWLSTGSRFRMPSVTY